MKLITLPKLFITLVTGIAITTAAIAAGLAGASASGHGTLLVTNDSQGNSVRRQFSFSAREMPDGTVTGNAVLTNPAFTGDTEQQYQLQIDISCMNVIGNTFFFGGTTQRTNDPNLVDAVYFSVEDNGTPGRNLDRISDAVFFDDDPNTTGDPGLCVGIQIGDFPMHTIETGNITTRQ